MDDGNIRFLIKRMDAMEARLADKIDSLQAFKNRVVGMAMVAGGIVSLIVEAVSKKL